MKRSRKLNFRFRMRLGLLLFFFGSLFFKAYGSNAYDGILSTSPGGGAGLSIDALWNSLSRSGRNAKHLQGIIEEDYQQNVIDYRFNRSYVANITKLKDLDLTNFMSHYRP